MHETISMSLPQADPDVIKMQIDNALARLTKRYVRHWKKDDEFCLTYDEHNRIMSRLADSAAEDDDFRKTVQTHSLLCLEEISKPNQSDLDDLLLRVPRVLEKLLLRRGEEFVTAVLSNTLHRVGIRHLADLIIQDLNEWRIDSEIIKFYPQLVATIIQTLLSEANTSTRNYLRRLANSYTLFTFLNHTPDVQSAVRKLFSHGTVWIDTTVLLPLLAERIEEDQEDWRLNKIVAACEQSGVEWRVTSGVIREIGAHMNVALKCSQSPANIWRGRIPYLYYKFIHSGKPPDEFGKWLSLFRGSELPEDDIAQFLLDVLGIQRHDLEEAALQVDVELRWAVERLWAEAHNKRRSRNEQLMDETHTRILIENDIETYLGVIALRQNEQITELGFRNWLLTLDHDAWAIRDLLKEEFMDKAPPSPLMSLSFMLNTISFGGLGAHKYKTAEISIPLILDIEMSESMPHDLLQLAEDVRRENEGRPEYVIRRMVRDAINKARRHMKCFDQDPIFDSATGQNP